MLSWVIFFFSFHGLQTARFLQTIVHETEREKNKEATQKEKNDVIV